MCVLKVEFKGNIKLTIFNFFFLYMLLVQIYPCFCNLHQKNETIFPADVI